MHICQKKKKFPLLQEISIVFFLHHFNFFFSTLPKATAREDEYMVGLTMETKTKEEVSYSFIWSTCQLCCILKSK